MENTEDKILSSQVNNYKLIFNKVNIAFALHEIIVDENNKPVDFIFLDVNPTYEKLTQLKASKVIGKKGTEVIPSLEQKWIDAYGEVAQTGKATTIIDHSEYLDKFWEVKAFSPQRNQFAVALTDISESVETEKALRESEKNYDTLFEAMTEMVVMHDLVFNAQGKAIDYRITNCNKAFTEITGISKKQAIGKLATELYQQVEPPYFEKFSNVAITGIDYHYTTYYPPMDKHFMISVVSPSKNKFATITTDITAIQQIKEIVSTKNKELENYLYVASHDLRSPLVNIQGFSQRLQMQTEKIKALIKNQKLDANTKHGIDKIFNSELPKTINYIFNGVNKMDKLIMGLLQISRTGRIAMNIKPISMNKLIDDVIRTHNYQLESINAKTKVNALPECYGDYDMLNQLFSNLLTNAIKYRKPSAQLKITIEGKKIYKKSIYSITDNGIGIEERHLEKIWDVFFQVNPQKNESGEGIGLSLVKRIAGKHLGKIRVESKKNIGTTFFIELQNSDFSE